MGKKNREKLLQQSMYDLLCSMNEWLKKIQRVFALWSALCNHKTQRSDALRTATSACSLG